MKDLQRSVYLLLFFFLVFGGLYFAKGFLIPLTLAAVLAMLFMGISNYFERKGINRGFSSLFSVLLFIVIVAIIFTGLSLQLTNFMENMDQMKESVMGMVNTVMQWINEKLGLSYNEQKEMLKEQGKGSSLPGTLMTIGINTILVIVYMYLLLFYRSRIKKFILKLVPKKDETDTVDVVHQSAKVIQKYLGGLGAMIAMLWVMYSIGFSIVGVENAIFFAILCGTLEIIPFVGNITGTSITVLAVMVQGGGSSMVIGVLITYFFIQFIQTYILEPLVVGEQVSINPLFTILVIVLGEMLWGAAGMFLAIPLLGIVKIICDNVPELQPYGFLIGSEKKRKGKDIPERLKDLFKKKKG